MSEDFTYTIPAIPTMYRGRQYRSRLEAKWAAFFDLMGWRHEYEPADLGKWSPDFMLMGEYGSTVFVEVKPISDFHQGTAAKMTQAAMDSDAYLLLVGTCPIVMDRLVFIGWTPHEKRSWARCPLVWSLHPDRPQILSDIYTGMAGEEDEDEWFGMLWHGFLDNGGGTRHYPAHTMETWAKASNAVQWKAPSQ